MTKSTLQRKWLSMAQFLMRCTARETFFSFFNISFCTLCYFCLGKLARLTGKRSFSGCGLVGKAVASDERDAWFESSHLLFLCTLICTEKSKKYRIKEAGNDPIKNCKRNILFQDLDFVIDSAYYVLALLKYKRGTTITLVSKNITPLRFKETAYSENSTAVNAINTYQNII